MGIQKPFDGLGDGHGEPLSRCRLTRRGTARRSRAQRNDGERWGGSDRGSGTAAASQPVRSTGLADAGGRHPPVRHNVCVGCTTVDGERNVFPLRIVATVGFADLGRGPCRDRRRQLSGAIDDPTRSAVSSASGGARRHLRETPGRRGRTAMRKHLALALLLLPALLAGACAPAEEGTLLLATTTSVRDSGLLDELLPLFSERTGIRVKTIAVGTGAALRMGSEGNVDVLLTHAPEAERELVASGALVSRRPFMENHFVIVGPPEDPAGVRAAASAAEAFRRIADADAPYVESRRRFRNPQTRTRAASGRRPRSGGRLGGLPPDRHRDGAHAAGRGTAARLRALGHRDLSRLPAAHRARGAVAARSRAPQRLLGAARESRRGSRIADTPRRRGSSRRSCSTRTSSSASGASEWRASGGPSSVRCSRNRTAAPTHE